MGQDVREIALDHGPPFAAFDLVDSRRAFQWRWGGGTIAVPATTTTTDTATASGPSVWFTSTAISTGGFVASSQGCVLSYIATWDPRREAWIVTEYRVPKQLVC